MRSATLSSAPDLHPGQAASAWLEPDLPSPETALQIGPGLAGFVPAEPWGSELDLDEITAAMGPVGPQSGSADGGGALDGAAAFELAEVIPLVAPDDPPDAGAESEPPAPGFLARLFDIF